MILGNIMPGIAEAIGCLRRQIIQAVAGAGCIGELVIGDICRKQGGGPGAKGDIDDGVAETSVTGLRQAVRGYDKCDGRKKKED